MSSLKSPKPFYNTAFNYSRLEKRKKRKEINIVIPPLGQSEGTSPLFSPWLLTDRRQHRAFAGTHGTKVGIGGFRCVPFLMAQVWKNLQASVRLATAHSFHKCLGICYFQENYWSFQKNAKIANPLVQVTSALTDLFPEPQIKLKDSAIKD